MTRRFGSVRTIQLCAIWYGGKAWAYFALKQYDQAIEWARRSIAINPNGRLPFAELSLAYLYTGRFEKSLESCDQAIRLSPRDLDCYRQNAGAYFALKQYDQAIEWARRTISDSRMIHLRMETSSRRSS